MKIDLYGALINGDPDVTLQIGGRCQNIQIATTAALVGSVTLTGAGGATVTTPPGLNGVMPGGELYSPVFCKLSDPADAGKVRVTWSMG